jgi:glutathione synthase/RimK-type ligase-like ATP-grasp enzyme
LLADAFARAGVDHDVFPWDAEVDWSRYDGVVVRSTWDYTERRDEFLRWVDTVSARTRFANPPDIIRWNTHKRYLAALADSGVPVVPTVWPRDGDAIPPHWTDIVVKPAVSAGGRLTGRFTSVAEATRFAHELLDGGHDVMAQQYVASVDAVGEAGVFFFGGEVSHAIRKGAILHRDAEPRTDASLGEGQSSEALPLRAAPVDFARSVLAAISGQSLYARVDCVTDDDGNDVVIEVELVEPYLFLSLDAGAPDRFAAAVVDWLGSPIG